jgi:hypothetical protein
LASETGTPAEILRQPFHAGNQAKVEHGRPQIGNDDANRIDEFVDLFKQRRRGFRQGFLRVVAHQRNLIAHQVEFLPQVIMNFPRQPLAFVFPDLVEPGEQGSHFAAGKGAIDVSQLDRRQGHGRHSRQLARLMTIRLVEMRLQFLDQGNLEHLECPVYR